jgi:hypothetical protein
MADYKTALQHNIAQGVHVSTYQSTSEPDPSAPVEDPFVDVRVDADLHTKSDIEIAMLLETLVRDRLADGSGARRLVEEAIARLQRAPALGSSAVA